MRQAAVVAIAMISFMLVGLPQLHIGDDVKSISGFVLGAINAGIGAYLGLSAPITGNALRVLSMRNRNPKG